MNLPTRKCKDCGEEKALAIHFVPSRPKTCRECVLKRKDYYKKELNKLPSDTHMAWNYRLKRNRTRKMDQAVGW